MILKLPIIRIGPSLALTDSEYKVVMWSCDVSYSYRISYCFAFAICAWTRSRCIV